MLKIYRIEYKDGKLTVEDHIDFLRDEFDTGLYGFGTVKSGVKGIYRANYELETLKEFIEYLQTVKKTDGWVNDLMLKKPMDYEMIEKKSIFLPKDIGLYEKNCLNEEAIILFANFAELQYPNNDLIQKVFGRRSDNGMYLILPNATFTITKDTALNGRLKEEFEVLQSQGLGKRLVLTKMDRKLTRYK